MRRSIRVLYTSAAAALTALAVGAPATAAASNPTAARLPDSCRAEFTATTPPRAIAATFVQDGRLRTAVQEKTAVSFTPRSMVFLYLTGTEPTDWHYLATAPDGTLQHVQTRQTRGEDAMEWASLPPRRAGTGWNATRRLVAPSADEPTPFVYGLTKTGLNRYRIAVTASGDPHVRSAGAVAKSGMADVRAIAWAHSTTGRNGADVLIAAAGDRLVEYTVPHADPSALRTRVLRERGWGSIAHLATGRCFVGEQETDALPFLGATPDGSIHAYLDRNRNNHKGTDIQGYGRIGSAGTLRLH